MLRVSLTTLILGTAMVFVVSPTAWAAPTAATAPATSAAPAASNGPGWLGVVVARGELKEWIDSTPIVDRPNRPLHFYGNTVRRRYYRGNQSKPGDVAQGGAAPSSKGK